MRASNRVRRIPFWMIVLVTMLWTSGSALLPKPRSFLISIPIPAPTPAIVWAQTPTDTGYTGSPYPGGVYEVTLKKCTLTDSNGNTIVLWDTAAGDSAKKVDIAQVAPGSSTFVDYFLQDETIPAATYTQLNITIADGFRFAGRVTHTANGKTYCTGGTAITTPDPECGTPQATTVSGGAGDLAVTLNLITAFPPNGLVISPNVETEIKIDFNFQGSLKLWDLSGGAGTSFKIMPAATVTSDVGYK